MRRALDAVIDVMRVPAAGRAEVAVVPATGPAPARGEACEILIAGGGTGGVAAALAAARAGRRVVLLEETDWLGGQMTAQGVAALDEHEHIEEFGGTAAYYRLRAMLRDHYRTLAGEVGRRPDFNPGACWVTRLAFEPRVAVEVIERMLRPHVEAGRLTIHRRTKTVAVTTDGDSIAEVVAMGLDDRRLVRFQPELVIDASELGDLLPLCGAEYVVGAETVAQTGERQAQPVEPKPHCVQSFTYTFACERGDEGERHVIQRPEKYEHFRSAQPYSLRIEVHGGEIYGETSGWLEYRLYDTMPGTKGGLWSYRRLLDRAALAGAVGRDLSLFNWPGNDYRDRSILECRPDEAARALQDAKRVSLGFLHWLQTEAPVTGARCGAPEIRLRLDVMGTADGLSKHPYIRESRRIRAVKTIVAQEVSAHDQRGSRAAHFFDSVGVGWYPIDIHRSGPDDVGASCRTKPFQIPLGALLPVRIGNLIAGGKNLGTTHITNGCYRLHPVEWNIGEAAGALAAFALEARVSPAAVRERTDLLGCFQRRLLDAGVPLAWLIDIGVDDPLFAPSQLLFMRGGLAGDGDLGFHPEAPISELEWRRAGGADPAPRTRGEAAVRLSGAR
ncbi:MAG: FAD-dependent oxidoreductase [Burkholderiales bacterium]|nr:FAD-dependent oxidoreductase [Burkholderiales bacterium]